MRQDYILGIDCGSTTAKSVIFTPDGHIAGIGRARIPQHTQTACHVERDLPETWTLVAGTVRDALANAGLEGKAIASIGVTAHGDGLVVLDRAGNPLGRGIMSLDSRTLAIHDEWNKDGLLDALMPIIGQRPYPYSATTLLAWIQRHEPERFRKIGKICFTKDWIRLRLTGRIATDLTEASTAFTDLYTQDYTPAALDMLGLGALSDALPEILLPTDMAGTITASAASATGLVEGTPVSAGLHDVTAAAVGLGNTRANSLTITAGTFSINEVYRAKPVVGTEWACRAAHKRGLWNCMAISPCSSSNLEWFTRIAPTAEREGSTNPLIDVEARLLNPQQTRVIPLYHPFLFGSPYETPASASFFGLQSWHDRTDLIHAMLEGTVFNHRTHVDALATTGIIEKLGIAGGGSGQPAIAQLFADALGREVEVAEVREAGALGAALTGAVACGMYPDLDDAVAAQDVGKHTYTPRTGESLRLRRVFQRYQALVDAVAPHWNALYAQADQSQALDVTSSAPAIHAGAHS